MVVFQLLLLIGYCYAHLSNRFMPTLRQSMVHLVVLALALLLVPFGLKEARGIDPMDSPKTWLILTLIQSVGVPYLLFSSSAPILQRWISQTSHPLASNPYPLYSASNIGSVLGLLAYPFVLEPLFTTSQQFLVLSGGFVLFVLAVALCRVTLTKHYVVHEANDPLHQAKAVVTRKQILLWVGLSFIPASLLYGVTSYIISDIASVPLIWIVPILLYLITYIFAFADSTVKLGRWEAVFAALACVTILLFFLPAGGNLWVVLIPLGAFFSGAFVFHRRLYDLRPATSALPLFYVMLALGGCLGGAFNVFIAPQIFTFPLEFPLVMNIGVIALLVLREAGKPAADAVAKKPFPLKQTVIGLVAAALFFAVFQATEGMLKMAAVGLLAWSVSFLVMGWIGWGMRGRNPLPVIATIAALLITGVLYVKSNSDVLYAERNFFGVNRVMENLEKKQRLYSHGVTVHGVQSTDEAIRLKPIAYYTPLKNVIAALPKNIQNEPIAVMGLGIGTIACYTKPNQVMDFYEIDEAVIRIAKDPKLFTYLSDCPGTHNTYLGDGRLEMLKTDDARYGMIIADAYSSDVIPVHLITREAIEMYGRKLKPNGVIAFNVSNRYLDLMPILATVSSKLGWYGISLRHQVDQEANPGVFSSRWIMLSPKKETVESLVGGELAWEWLPAMPDDKYYWTDQYTNFLSVIKTKE